MQTIEFTYHIDEIEHIAHNVLEYLNSKTILVNGDMGAGKTTFIGSLLNAMNSIDNVTSPTFSIVNEYNIPNDKVYHFDFYRIESLEEAYNFGIEEYLYSNYWLFIEWPNRIKNIIPKDNNVLEIKIIENDFRKIVLTF